MKQLKIIIYLIFTTLLFSLKAVLAGQLMEWKFIPNQNQLEFTLGESSNPKYFILENPLRIVIDIPNTQLGNVAPKANYNSEVREIRLSQFSPQITRLVMEFSPEFILKSEQVKLEKIKENKWKLSYSNSNVTVTVPPLQPQAQPRKNPHENSPKTAPIIQFGQQLRIIDN